MWQLNNTLVYKYILYYAGGGGYPKLFVLSKRATHFWQFIKSVTFKTNRNRVFIFLVRDITYNINLYIKYSVKMVGNPRPRDYKYEEFDGTDLVKSAVRRFQCKKKNNRNCVEMITVLKPVISIEWSLKSFKQRCVINSFSTSFVFILYGQTNVLLPRRSLGTSARTLSNTLRTSNTVEYFLFIYNRWLFDV